MGRSAEGGRATRGASCRPVQSISAPYADFYQKYFTSTAQSFGVEIIALPVADIAALESFVAAQAREPNTGLVPMPSAFMTGHEIVEIVTRNALPAVSFNREFAKAGGLMSYGNDVSDNCRRSATFVDRILRGEKPSDLPVEVPVKFESIGQSQNRQGSRSQHSSDAARHRRRGDRIATSLPRAYVALWAPSGPSSMSAPWWPSGPKQTSGPHRRRT